MCVISTKEFYFLVCLERTALLIRYCAYYNTTTIIIIIWLTVVNSLQGCNMVHTTSTTGTKSSLILQHTNLSVPAWLFAVILRCYYGNNNTFIYGN